MPYAGSDDPVRRVRLREPHGHAVLWRAAEALGEIPMLPMRDRARLLTASAPVEGD
jgi:hypothetical protein